MVHSTPSDRASSNVPEELYNLTQLADVTLAAGKLSTIEANQQALLVKNNPISDTTNLLQQSPINPPRYSHDITTTPTHSVIRNWSFEPATTLPFQPFASKSTMSTIMSTHHAYSNSEDDCSDATTTTINFPSTKLYAHKIFDKRKVRKLSYQSNDSVDFEARRMSRFLEATQTAVTVQPNDERLGTMMTGDDDDYEDHEGGMDGDELEADFGEVLGGVGEDGVDIHTCPECGKRYSTSSNLARHRQTHRSLMDKKARRCPHCDKVYVSMPAFSMHVRTHNQGCECPHCGKRFSRPWLLQGHIRTHTGEKPFECSICAKAFADKSNLRAHIQTHSNTKPHTCTRCGKSFALKSYLYKHEESSCIRSLTGKSSDKDTKSTSKSQRSNSSISSASSTVSSANNSPKVSKTRGSRRGSPSVTSSELQKRFKEKLRDKLRGGCCGKEDEVDIVMDTGSQKSYIQLMNPVRGDPHYQLPENGGDLRNSATYSRCSVIRSATSACDEHEHLPPQLDQDRYLENNVSFFSNHHLNHNHHSMHLQEKPVDFSPKNKFASTGSGNSGSGNGSGPNGFEMVLNYTMVA